MLRLDVLCDFFCHLCFYYYVVVLAETVRFELTSPFGLTVFKAVTFDHSVKFPNLFRKRFLIVGQVAVPSSVFPIGYRISHKPCEIDPISIVSHS